MGITVRKAELADAEAATGVYIHGFTTYIPLDPIVCWQDFWAHEPILAEMKADIKASLSGNFNKKAVHVLEIDGVIVGFCRATRLNKTTVEINQIALRQDATGMGLGQLLMTKVAQDYQGAGCEALITNGTITCPQADNFFRGKMGMSETGSGRYTWNHGEIIYITYEAPLSQITAHTAELDETQISAAQAHLRTHPVLTKDILQQQATPIYEQACATLPANIAIAKHFGLSAQGLFHAFEKGQHLLRQIEVTMHGDGHGLDPADIKTRQQLGEVGYTIAKNPAL